MNANDTTVTQPDNIPSDTPFTLERRGAIRRKPTPDNKHHSQFMDSIPPNTNTTAAHDAGSLQLQQLEYQRCQQQQNWSTIVYDSFLALIPDDHRGDVAGLLLLFKYLIPICFVYVVIKMFFVRIFY